MKANLLSIAIFLGMYTSLFGQTFSDASGLLNPISSPGSSGASAIDFNNDGLVDIYSPGRLYLNKGASGFVDVLPSTKIIEGDGIFGAVFGDYDGDGFVDVLFEDLLAPGRLYRNKGNGKFVQVNAVTNLTSDRLVQGSGWSDFNGDGLLDLFIGNDAGDNQLFKNVGQGRFQDISISAGVPIIGHTYGMTWGDFNNDGLADIFVAPYSAFPETSIKHLFRNNGDETFTNIATQAGVADSLASWGVIWLDYDNDGWLDVYIANIHTTTPGQVRENKLYRNNGDETFTDVSTAAGVVGTISDESYAMGAGDFDNDGWLDIYVANSGTLHNLYHNNGDGTFSDIATAAGLDDNSHFAVALADYNNDGWLDIYTPGELRSNLWLNNGGTNHWLSIRTRGAAANYYGVGARIEVYIDGALQIREIRAGDSFCSQNLNQTAHFGLGVQDMVDSLIVKWPGGGIDKHFSKTADQQILLVEGGVINNPPQSFSLLQPTDESLLGNPTSPIEFSWENAVDPEGDNLTYRLHLTGPEIDTVFSDISGTSFSVEVALFQQQQICSWTVDVNDEHSTTGSFDVFQFVDAAC